MGSRTRHASPGGHHAAVLDAHRAADELNGATEFIQAHTPPPGGGELGESIWRRVENGAKKAIDAFEKARDALKKP